MQNPNPSVASPTQYVFDVLEDVPEFGLRVGDRVTVTYGAAWPVAIIRELPPNYGGILDLFERGSLEVLDEEPGAASRFLRQRQAVQQGGFRLRLIAASSRPSSDGAAAEPAEGPPTP